MFLKKIILRNFRQFYGEQEIEFSSDPEKNVTLIHAGNGVGKTTLMNAFLWCFYKDLTQKFDYKDNLVSNQAVEEGDNVVSVDVFFQHDNLDYLIKRKIDNITNDEFFTATVIENGNYKQLDNPVTFVTSVVPVEMSEYFFFDGEYAESFSRIKNKSNVKKAVETMLGCNIAIQATRDLEAIKKDHERQIAALSKGKQSQTFQSQIDKLELENNEKDDELIQIDEQLEVAEFTCNEIDSKLRNSETAKEIQSIRASHEESKKRAEDNKIKIMTKKINWINNSSIGLLSNKVITQCSNLIKDENIKGKIPSIIAETFVNDILENNVCICNRHFNKGTTEEKAIKSLLAEAGNTIMNDRLLAVNSRMKLLKNTKNSANSEFRDISGQLMLLNEEINDLEIKIKECSTKLLGCDVTEIAERERARQGTLKEIQTIVEKKTLLRKEYDDNKLEIDRLKVFRNKLLVHNEKAKGLQNKVKLLDATINQIKIELDEYRETSRKIIIEKVNNILDKTTRRNYFAHIDESFKLDLFHEESKLSVGASSGENQLLSLAFIASLVNFAFDRLKENINLLKPGTMAPLMLDSPFGQLDSSYRKSTAKFLPELAGQVVLLVSNTQGDDDVIAALGDKIGSEYVLISEVQDTQGDRPSDIIQLHGNEIACSLYECEKNKTKIQKIARGK